MSKPKYITRQISCCCIPGCGKPCLIRKSTKGVAYPIKWCGHHNSRVMRYGDPLANPPTPKERFWANVDKKGKKGCWLWTGGQDDDGYGHIKVRGATIKAHRFSWLLHFGEIKGNLWVLHRCDIPACVNPNHLFLGDVLVNNRDCKSKGRMPIGEDRHTAVLTEVLVKKLRREYVYGSRTKGTVALARKYKVSQTAVWCAVNCKWWSHVL